MTIREAYELAEKSTMASTAKLLSMLAALIAQILLLVSAIAKNCMH